MKGIFELVHAWLDQHADQSQATTSKSVVTQYQIFHKILDRPAIYDAEESVDSDINEITETIERQIRFEVAAVYDQHAAICDVSHELAQVRQYFADLAALIDAELDKLVPPAFSMQSPTGSIHAVCKSLTSIYLQLYGDSLPDSVTENIPGLVENIMAQIQNFSRQVAY